MSIGAIGAESAGALRAGRRAVHNEVPRLVARSPLFWVGALILLFWIVCAIFGAQIAPHSAFAQNLEAINRSPSWSHLFGTDTLGRDMFSRVLVGSRDILFITPLATLLATVLGTALGLVMGYFRGITDDIVGRIVEAVLALPAIVLALIVVAAVGRSDLTLILVIAIVFTPLIARTVRAAVQQERELDYVSAARLRGEGSLYVMFVEILPNVFAPVMVEFTVRLGYAVFFVVTLSFLGFGIQPPSPDWGLEVAQNYGQVANGFWWEVLFDALAIASLVVAVNLIGDTIENVLER